mmetsp:Transcript_42089/g.104790  ORF Transcript_42089/g.104790 Transcript_42089/m.104790 type:complete len:203 (-) Transcript_42089:64-672(-)
MSPTMTASKARRYLWRRAATRAGWISLRRPMRCTRAIPIPSAIVASPRLSPMSNAVPRPPTSRFHCSAPIRSLMVGPFLLNMWISGSVKPQMVPPPGSKRTQLETTGRESTSTPGGSRVRSTARTTLPSPAEHTMKGTPRAWQARRSSTKPSRSAMGAASAACCSIVSVSGSLRRSVCAFMYHSCMSGTFCSRVRCGSISMG